MDKKKSFHSEARFVPVKEWTPPSYHKGREFYIDFYAFNPSEGRLKRKKIMLGRFRSQRERNAYARQLIEELTQKLVRGWNPWVESKSAAQFTSFQEVTSRYRQYVVKMHSDSS